MTTQQKKEILESAAERAFDQIAATDGKDMTSEGFMRLMTAAEQLSWMTVHVGEMGTEANHPTAAANPAPAPAEAEPASKADAPKPAPKPTGEPRFTKEELRMQLAALADKYEDSTLIPNVMNSMGYSKLSEVPAERYNELWEKVNTAAEGK